MDTLLACLTAPGKAAIATIGLRGPQAWTITRELFVPRKGALPDEPTAGQTWYGKLGNEYADDVILAVKDIGLEVHCHGGVEVVRMIQSLYEERGAKIVTWQQFLDKPIIALLAQAPTARTAGILLDQANRAWQDCTREKLDAERLRRLTDLIPLGQHLVTPWKVVIAGAPNVGKSSLMNVLAGYTRSIVAPTPGTTRDNVTACLAIDGWPIEMSDTAGIRESSSGLERQGIERAHGAIAHADLRIWLLDGAAEPNFPADPEPWTLVINKIDLPADWDWQRVPQALRISAHMQAGLAELCEVISRKLVPHPPEAGEAVPCLPEQVNWLSSFSARMAPCGR